MSPEQQMTISTISLNDIISLIALATSFVAAGYTFFRDRKIRYSDFESNHYNEIFAQYFMIEFPKDRDRLSFDNGYLSKTEKLVDDLNSLEDQIQYFYYADNCFFKRIKKAIQSTTDYIAYALNTKWNRYSDREKFEKKLTRCMKKMYRIIRWYYRK